MTTANNLVSKTLGTFLTESLYIEIHKLAFAHDVEKSGSRRTNAVSVDLEIKNQDQKALIEAKDYLVFSEFKASDISYKIHQKITGIHNISVKFNEIIDCYYSRIDTLNNNEEKLILIAETHLHLEWLHKFIDGNTRLNKLILNKFLAENGLPLCVLDTPLGAEHTSLSKWITKIKQGQELWTTETEKVTPEKRALYLEKKLKRQNEKIPGEKIAKKYNENEKLKQKKGLVEQEKMLKYEESDTSSDEENFNKIEEDKEKSQTLNGRRYLSHLQRKSVPLPISFR